MTATGSDVPEAAPAASRRRRVASWEWAAVASAMAVVAVIGALAIRRGVPLLWDEAVYSLRTRELTTDAVIGSYWLDVRAPGLPVALTPTAWLLGASDVAFRATALLFAVAGVGITWLIARLLTGPVIAAVTAWLLATAPGWHDSSWQVMPDIPGATLTLAAMAVILLAGRGDRMSWWALAAAPLAFAATLVRYGAPLLIGPTVVAALLLRWPAARAAPVRAAAALLAPAAAAATVWFVPEVTSSPRAPVLIYAGRQDAKAIPAAESAADFLASLGGLVGPLFGTLVVVGGIAAVAAARRDPRLRGPVVASALIALSVLVAMLFGIAEYHLRYLVPALPFLALLAATGLVHLARTTPVLARSRLAPTRARAATAHATVAAAIVVAGTALATQTALTRADHIDRATGPTRAAYDRIDERANGDCLVLDHSPAAGWYSHCTVLRASNVGYRVRRLAETDHSDTALWIVLHDGRSAVDLDGAHDRLEPGDADQGRWLTLAARYSVASSPTSDALHMGSIAAFDAELRRRHAAIRAHPPSGRTLRSYRRPPTGRPPATPTNARATTGARRDGGGQSGARDGGGRGGQRGARGGGQPEARGGGQSEARGGGQSEARGG